MLTRVDVGAAGETATQLRTTLHLPDSGTNIAPAFAAVTCQDATDGSSAGNQLLIANSLWSLGRRVRPEPHVAAAVHAL